MLIGQTQTDSRIDISVEEALTDDMERRRVVACLAGLGLAGCAGQETSRFETTNNATSSPTNDSSISETETLTATAAEPPSSIAEAELSFEVTKSRESTHEHPAQIEIQVTNEGRARKLNFVGTAPFGGYVGDGPVKEGLVLHPKKPHEVVIAELNGDEEFQVVPDSQDGDCWNRLDRPESPPTNLYQITLGEGESFVNTYTVLVNKDSGCVESGEYRFSNRFQVPGDDVWFEWGFTLQFPVEIPSV